MTILKYTNLREKILRNYLKMYKNSGSALINGCKHNIFQKEDNKLIGKYYLNYTFLVKNNYI
jgi:hypothetical protein